MITLELCDVCESYDECSPYLSTVGVLRLCEYCLTEKRRQVAA